MPSDEGKEELSPTWNLEISGKGDRGDGCVCGGEGSREERVCTVRSRPRGEAERQHLRGVLWEDASHTFALETRSRRGSWVTIEE